MTIAFENLWQKFRSKKFREHFVAAQAKRAFPFQLRAIMKKRGLSQEKLAAQSNLTQGVISRAVNPNYGNLTSNTKIRIAAGLDMAYLGVLVPYSQLAEWISNLSEESVLVATFEEEDRASESRKLQPGSWIGKVDKGKAYRPGCTRPPDNSALNGLDVGTVGTIQ